MAEPQLPQPQGPSLEEEMLEAVIEARQQLLDNLEYLPKDSDALKNNKATLQFIIDEMDFDLIDALCYGRREVIDELEYLPKDSAVRKDAEARLVLMDAVLEKHNNT
jgi:hypothetical protein